jgi:predicted dithiol-disulfide oxidoreductase (DUF899 family)
VGGRLHELRRRVDQYGNTAQVHERDTTIAVVSRAPIDKIERGGARWAGRSLVRELRQPLQLRLRGHLRRDPRNPTYNYRSPRMAGAWGVPELPSELHGTSVFLTDGERVFTRIDVRARHEQVGGTHYYLDMTPLGRQEDWSSPRAARTPSAPRRSAPSGSDGRQR